MPLCGQVVCRFFVYVTAVCPRGSHRGATRDVLRLVHDHLDHVSQNALPGFGLTLVFGRHRSPENPQQNEGANPEHRKGKSNDP